MHARLADLVSPAAAAALALAFAPTSAYAQVNTLPPELRDLGVDEHLGARVPLDGVFRDHHGAEVHLAQYFDGRRPVILNLAYYRCPMLCNMVTNALINSLRQNAWTVGQQFDVVTLSIDPREGPGEASEKRGRVLEQYGRNDAQTGWHFLTGEDREIRRVSNAVGFHYRYDPRIRQYAHPAAIFLLMPDGRIARYLYGIEFRPNDVRVGLLEASQGHAISTVERLILFCYHYDPQGRQYVIVAMRVMQLGGIVTIILLGGLLATLWAKDRRRNRPPSDTGRDSARQGPITASSDVRS